jgi:hypothetical protein
LLFSDEGYSFGDSGEMDDEIAAAFEEFIQQQQK